MADLIIKVPEGGERRYEVLLGENEVSLMLYDNRGGTPSIDYDRSHFPRGTGVSDVNLIKEWVLVDMDSGCTVGFKCQVDGRW